MTKKSKEDALQGKRVRIMFCSNQFAQDSVGRTGTVSGYAAGGTMVIVTLDDSEQSDHWAFANNLQIL